MVLNNIQMIDFEQKIYKGYTIDKFVHPSLYGKYEVYDIDEKFIGRFLTLKECYTEINKIKKKINKINYGKNKK